jgi:septum formation protein
VSTPPILLASASPRRRELFGHLGYPFTVTSVEVDETPRPGEPVAQLVQRLALEKARAARPQNPRGVTVGCDTLVEIDGQVLGKPVDEAEARNMLSRLSGDMHRVWTAVALLGPGESEACEVSVTAVRFRDMEADEIAAYVATGEPMDKAGAYGIQERGAVFVEGVTGDYFTVVGLPLCLLGQMLKEIVGKPTT